MVMVIYMPSLGSVLLYEFDIMPFIVELAGSTSTGKTFTLNLVASVGVPLTLQLHGVLLETALRLWLHF